MPEEAVTCVVRCWDGFRNSQVYPTPINKGGTVEVPESVAKKMQETQTGVVIESRKLKLNKPKRRKKADEET